MKRSLAILCLIFWSTFCTGQNISDTTRVYFDFNQHTLTDLARQHLNAFIAAIGTDPAGIELRGHCDARGSHAYNDRLSTQRVEAVRDYLLANGLQKEAIAVSKGFGERVPVREGDSEEARQQNRRVELIFKRSTPVSAPQPPQQPDITLKEKIDSVQEGETLRLQNINFYGGRHTFLPQSLPALEELLEVMRSHPTLEIEIQGHICCFTGGEDGMDFDSNDRRLSVNRARAVYTYLVRNGIDKSRMTYQGYAGTRLLVYPETSEADRTMNRRVEIRIVKK